MAFSQSKYHYPATWGDAPGYGDERPSAKKMAEKPGEI